jgi:zinc protease
MALVALKAPGRDELSYGAYRSTVMEILFSVMFNMRIREISEEVNPPFLHAGGSFSEFIGGGIRALSLYVIPKNDEFDLGFERILTETFRIDQHGFTPTELTRAKETILAQTERAYNERDKTENKSLAGELSGYFGGTESFAGVEKD